MYTDYWSVGKMEHWRTREVERWRLDRWRDGQVERWRGGGLNIWEVESWRYEKWRGGEMRDSCWCWCKYLERERAGMKHFLSGDVQQNKWWEMSSENDVIIQVIMSLSYHLLYILFICSVFDCWFIKVLSITYNVPWKKSSKISHHLMELCSISRVGSTHD